MLHSQLNSASLFGLHEHFLEELYSADLMAVLALPVLFSHCLLQVNLLILHKA